MDHRSSRPGAAFPCGGGDIESRSQPQSLSHWDPAFVGPLLFESLYSDHTLDPAAVPSASQALGPQTCASQAVRAPPYSPGVGTIRYCQFPSESARRPAPAAAIGHCIPVPPSALSNLARFYTTNLDRTRCLSAHCQQTCVPTQTLPAVTYPASSTAFANWGLDILGVVPNPAYALPQSFNGDNLGFFPSARLPSGVLSNTASAVSAADSPWSLPQAYDPGPATIENGAILLAPVNFDTASDGSDTRGNDGGGLGASSIDCKTSSLSRSPYTLSPGRHKTRSRNHGQCGPSVSPGTTAPGDARSYFPSMPSPCPERPRAVTKVPQTPLAIVHYRPSDPEGRPSRKRPALEEITPQDIASPIFHHVLLEDLNGDVQGAMINFGKRARTRTPLSQEKRRQTAQARKGGVCARCKKSKRQVLIEPRRAWLRPVDRSHTNLVLSVILPRRRVPTRAARFVPTQSSTRVSAETPVSSPPSWTFCFSGLVSYHPLSFRGPPSEFFGPPISTRHLIRGSYSRSSADTMPTPEVPRQTSPCSRNETPFFTSKT